MLKRMEVKMTVFGATAGLAVEIDDGVSQDNITQTFEKMVEETLNKITGVNYRVTKA